MILRSLYQYITSGEPKNIIDLHRSVEDKLQDIEIIFAENAQLERLSTGSKLLPTPRLGYTVYAEAGYFAADSIAGFYIYGLTGFNRITTDVTTYNPYA